MKNRLLVIFFLLSQIVFSQENNEVVLVDNSNSFSETFTNKLSYIASSQKISIDELLKSDKNFKPYDDFTYEKFSAFDFPKNLYLKGKIKNATNDTIHLILTTSRSQKTEVVLSSQHEKITKNIGLILKEEELYVKEIHNSMTFLLFPKEEKTIVLTTTMHLTDDSISKITLYTKDQFDSMLLDFYQSNHNITLLFAVLSGGLFLLFFYNLFMFFKTRQKNYLYYSCYLLFTFLNLCLIIDRIQFNLIGNFLNYYALIQEATYTLSFIFYTLFVRSMLLNIGKNLKKVFQIYLFFMLSYILYISISSIYNQLNITFIDVLVAYLFRIITLVFAIISLIHLLKNYNLQYIKYIFIGSLILTISYLLHVIFNILNGSRLSNHFYNLVGSLLEILFFTYALHIKTFQIEKEKIISENLRSIKSRFFANISHEFRTPLTLIKSPVQSLQSKLSNDDQLKELKLIETNATRMLQLVDQLLELSKIDSGNLKLILKDGNISSFLTSIIEPFEFQSKEKGIHFTSNIQKTSENNSFDKDIIEKIVTNLVSNAFKYTPQNESIGFTSSIENSTLQLVVSNTGSDVKKEDLPKLFERFYQKNETQQGVGIGLALVKELVDLYRGTIITSVENGKLSFVVSLPLSLTNENAVVIPSHETTSAIKNTTTSETELPILLIVDDNTDIRMILKDIFKNDYQILEAKDGEEGLQIAQNQIPDCIISDVMMPKMDGFEFTKQIKNNELTSFVPVILLTAKTSDEAHLEGLKNTADAFLTKPFNNEIVKATVQQLITERKKLHERYSQELVLKPVDIVINSVDEKFIERLQNILDKNLSNSEFSIEDFATEIGVSRMQLHRKLKSLLGVSATEFLRSERLKVGAELLKQGNGNISEIAYSIGFSDVSYFSKCFKEMYQCTPTEYMEK